MQKCFLIYDVAHMKIPETLIIKKRKFKNLLNSQKYSVFSEV